MRDDAKDQTLEPELPPCDLGYLIAVLFDLGPVKAGAMGPIEVDEERLQAWQSNTGIELLPWESRMLKRLSRDYLSEAHKAASPKCPPPWTPLAIELDRPAIETRIKALFRS